VDGGVALAEITNKQSAAKYSKRRRRERDAPGRIERTVVDAERQVADAVRIEPADEAVADALLVFARYRVNLGVCDVERAADFLDVERVVGVRRRRRRDGRVGEWEAGRRLQSE